MINHLVDYNQIIKDCFWDYSITENDIINILKSNDMRLKQKLFSKIIYNSTDKARTLMKLFDEALLKKLFDTFTSSYNQKHIDRSVLVLKNILLGEKNAIKGLEWKKR